MNPDGTGQAALTSGPDNNYSPAWSPDGTKIAFTRQSDATHHWIYVMNADGTDPSRLTDSGADSSPKWSPDGTKIAFTRQSDATHHWIYVMNADGTNPTRVTSGGTDGSPAWSPDGTKIAFSSGDNGKFVFVIGVDGSHLTQLTRDPSLAPDPTWSPDGKTILFNAEVSHHFELDEVNADGTGLRTLFHTDTQTEVAWSPDGTKMAFDVSRGTWSAIYVMNADGTDPVPVANTPNVVSDSPAWSPDGHTLAYVASPPGDYFTNDIYVMNPDGTGQTKLTNGPNFINPTWRPTQAP